MFADNFYARAQRLQRKNDIVDKATTKYRIKLEELFVRALVESGHADTRNSNADTRNSKIIGSFYKNYKETGKIPSAVRSFCEINRTCENVSCKKIIAKMSFTRTQPNGPTYYFCSPECLGH